MKINIISAPGAGSTTLAKHLSYETGFIHLDSDDYFWTQQGRPYEFPRDADERNRMITEDFNKQKDLILSGPVFHWNVPFINDFDLAAFIYIPREVRMKRLFARERERYGTLLETDEWIKQQHRDFMEFASQYEEPDFQNSRSLRRQTEWLNQLLIPVIRFEREMVLEDMVSEIIEKIREIENR